MLGTARNGARYIYLTTLRRERRNLSMTKNKLEAQIKEYADGLWPRRTPFSRLRKLGEEFGELTEACANFGQDARFGKVAAIKEEAADMAIILTDFISLLGGSLEEEMVKKMRVNVQRTQQGSLSEFDKK